MLNLDDTAYVFGTTKFDDVLAKVEPPTFATIDENTPPDVVSLLRTAGTSAARQYDRYKEIRHISHMHQGRYIHLVLAEDEMSGGESTTEINLAVPGRSTCIQPMATEGELVSTFWTQLMNMGVAGPAIVAGWKIGQLWALLVNKALKYGIKVPQAFRQNLAMRYASNDRLLDLTGAYLQGISPAVRLLPELQDALAYWDPAIPGRHEGAFPSTSELQHATWEDWKKLELHRRVELMLDGMALVLAAYEAGGDDGPIAMHNVPGPVGASARGPRP